MTVNLIKGQNVPLDSGLKLVRVGLGWSPRREPGEEFDLDASVFLLGESGKVRSDADLIFYNQPKSQWGRRRRNDRRGSVARSRGRRAYRLHGDDLQID